MATSSINNLSSTYRSLISNILESEKQPVYRLEQEKDTLTVRKAV
jgi:hypothetical protein